MMEKKQFCKQCGKILTNNDRYKSGTNRYRKVCRECFSKSVSKSRKLCNRKYHIRVRRRNNSSLVLEFDTWEELNSFRTYRRLQIRYGKVAVSESTDFGKRVEDLHKRVEDGKEYHYYSAARCEECGSALRYDEREYEVCEKCGLVRGGDFISIERPYIKSSTDPRSDTYNHYVPIDESGFTHDPVYEKLYYARKHRWN